MTIEVTAKKVDDAIKQGLTQLGATLDDVKVEVLESGGLFRKAKVRLTLEKETEQSDEKSKPDRSARAETAKESVKRDEVAKEQQVTAVEKPGKTAEKREGAANVKPAAAKKAVSSKNVSAPVADGSENQSEKSLTRSAQTSQEKQPSENIDKPLAPKHRAEEKTDAKTQEEPKSEEAVRSKDPRAKRRIRPEDREAASHALEFVKQTVALMGFPQAVTTAAEDEDTSINIEAAEGDDSLIIGRHGETLSALTYLAETVARAEKCHVNFTVDCNGYRARRAQSLTAMAKRRAHESAAKHRKIKLEPMDRTDRRTIHCALADDAYVTTESEGKEPYRCVVIVPKDGVVYEAEDDRKGRRDRRDRGGRNRGDRRESGGEKPRRAAFDVNIHGFVGHNDHAEEENAAEKAESNAQPDKAQPDGGEE